MVHDPFSPELSFRDKSKDNSRFLSCLINIPSPILLSISLNNSRALFGRELSSSPDLSTSTLDAVELEFICCLTDAVILLTSEGTELLRYLKLSGSSAESTGSSKCSGSCIFGGMITSTFGGVVIGDWRGVVAGVLLKELVWPSFCSEFKFSGSDIFPPSKNLVGGIILPLRGRLSGRKNLERMQQWLLAPTQLCMTVEVLLLPGGSTSFVIAALQSPAAQHVLTRPFAVPLQVLKLLCIVLDAGRTCDAFDMFTKEANARLLTTFVRNLQLNMQTPKRRPCVPTIRPILAIPELLCGIVDATAYDMSTSNNRALIGHVVRTYKSKITE
uniref:Uncharacterized protein n=1 Tax=Glossina pallidipes TaxID=7398 RepID=A0A1A9ZFS7_GLOPL